MNRLVLALDLSSSRGSVAVLRAGELIFTASFLSERSHNACLFGPLGQALDHAGHEPDGLIVVGTGPGSYTGVRISIAAAQGVGLARHWPILGIPSICTAAASDYQVIGDARRGMYYHARISQGRMIQAPTLREANAMEQLWCDSRGQTWVSFDSKPPLPFPGLLQIAPDAAALARLALSFSLEEKQSLAATPLEPYYLQEAFITTARKMGKHVPAQ